MHQFKVVEVDGYVDHKIYYVMSINRYGDYSYVETLPTKEEADFYIKEHKK